MNSYNASEWYENLLLFVKESTKHFDESHDWTHAAIVTKSTHIVMKSLGNEYEEKLVTYAAMLHDVCDHKYPDSISREKLEGFISENLEKVDRDRVLAIIDNVSYSKQAKGKRIQLPEPDCTYLVALSDADRLEAIGEIGIKRCATFTLERGGKVPEGVIEHCHEKLLRLLPDGFIVTELGRKMALPLHQEILDYVAENTPLISA